MRATATAGESPGRDGAVALEFLIAPRARCFLKASQGPASRQRPERRFRGSSRAPKTIDLSANSTYDYVESSYLLASRTGPGYYSGRLERRRASVVSTASGLKSGSRPRIRAERVANFLFSNQGDDFVIERPGFRNTIGLQTHRHISSKHGNLLGCGLRCAIRDNLT